jgi:hypothetical protein
MLANYKCLKCEHEYSHPPRPTECPICGHLYVKWLNYEEMFGGRVLEEEYYDSNERLQKASTMVQSAAEKSCEEEIKKMCKQEQSGETVSRSEGGE